MTAGHGPRKTRITAGETGRALRRLYPDDDVKARREPGGVRASVFSEDGGIHVSVGDRPGILSALLGLGDYGPGGDAGILNRDR